MLTSYKDWVGSGIHISRHAQTTMVDTESYCGKLVPSGSAMDRSGYWAIVHDAIDVIGPGSEGSRKFLAYCVCQDCKEASMHRPGAYDWETVGMDHWSRHRLRSWVKREIERIDRRIDHQQETLDEMERVLDRMREVTFIQSIPRRGAGS